MHTNKLLYHISLNESRGCLFILPIILSALNYDFPFSPTVKNNFNGVIGIKLEQQAKIDFRKHMYSHRQV